MGLRVFDIIIGLITRFRPAFIVRDLARIYPGDFAAAEAFDPCEHEVLLAAMTYNLYLLADPEFDAADRLCIQLESPDADDRIRDHPIADSIAIRQMVAGLTAKLANLDPDAAKALWASLSFAQDAQLSIVAASPRAKVRRRMSSSFSQRPHR